MLFPKGYKELVECKHNIDDTNTHYKKNKQNYKSRNGTPKYCHLSCRRGRASYVTLRGGITVEASIVLPIVVFAMVVLIQVMVFMNLQLKIQTALYHQAVKAAGYSYLADSVENYLTEDMDTDDYAALMSIMRNGITEAVIKYMVEGELGSEFFEKPWIKGGGDGLNIIFRQGDGERELDVVLQYELRTCFDIFGIGNIPMTARAVLGRWSGVTRIAEDEDDLQENGKVYITKSGTVYHLYRDCTYLSISLTRIMSGQSGAYRNASGGKYYPCSVCVRKEYGEGDYVYISKYGECYHADNKCRNIYHNVIEIAVNDVGSRSLCSKCREKKEAYGGEE